VRNPPEIPVAKPCDALHAQSYAASNWMTLLSPSMVIPDLSEVECGAFVYEA